MGMLQEAPRSALALLHRPRTFVLQLRPNLPGRLAYPGKAHFFGGGVHPGEEPEAALYREIGEEIDELALVLAPPKLLWRGRYLGEDKHGNPALRHISLFGVEIDAGVPVSPMATEGGGVLEVPQTLEPIQALQPAMAPFAYEALTSYVQHGQVLID